MITVTASRSEVETGSTTSSVDNSSIKLYPNPTTSSVTLEITGNTGATTVLVTDISGKVISTHTTEESTLSIDMSNVAPGIYLFTVNTGGKMYSEKVIVQ